MLAKTASGAAILAMAMFLPAGATAQISHVDCMIARSGPCGAEIPVPTPRPDESFTELSRDDIKYIEVAGAAGEIRRIRLVGPRFLPPKDEMIDFAGRDQPGLVDAAIHRIVAYFSGGDGPEKEGVATAGLAESDPDDIVGG